METSVVLESGKFGEFIRCLSLLKEVCNDVDIRDGYIRQRTTDLASIFEINLSPIIGAVNIPLTILKQKLDLLKTFLEHEVRIDITDSDVTFSDEYSSLKVNSPKLEYMDNKYISESELSSVLVIDEENLLLSVDLQKPISDRIKVITQVFNVRNVSIDFSGENATISAKTNSKDQSAKFISGINTEKVLDYNCNTNVVVDPFIIDCDSDIQFKIYTATDNICFSKFSTFISDVDINIYTRSILMEQE